MRGILELHRSGMDITYNLFELGVPYDYHCEIKQLLREYAEYETADIRQRDYFLYHYCERFEEPVAERLLSELTPQERGIWLITQGNDPDIHTVYTLDMEWFIDFM